MKDAYKILPKLTYPAFVITEIINEENFKFTDNLGEHVSNVGYQIDCYSRAMQGIEAKDIVSLMGNLVNSIATGSNYKLRRVGQPVIMTLQTDTSVLMYRLRFEGCIDLDTHTIYSTTN